MVMAARGQRISQHGQLCRLRVGRSHDSSTGRGPITCRVPQPTIFVSCRCLPAKEVLGNQGARQPPFLDIACTSPCKI